MKKKTIIVIGVLITIITIIGISYAFISTSGKQDIANTIISGCLNVKIETEGTAINESGISPITDIEGLKTNGYTFTIKNTCDKETNYEINLESINTDNKLDPKYIRVSLSSNTNDNIIVNLNENESNKREATINNAYESYNLYTGTISGNASKKFTIKEWMDYKTTKEEGANKTYQSKINVIANPELETTKQAEIKFTQEGTEVTGTIEGEIETIKYCTTTDNECDPQDEITNENNTIKPKIETNEKEQIVCVKINNEETICSNPMTIKLEPSDKTLAELGLTKSEEGCPEVENGETIITDIEDTQQLICSAEDNDGTSYYYRGAVTNNWIKFGENDDGTPVWWRIVRINGDGTIRLIYAGTGVSAPSQTDTNSVVAKNQYYSVSGTYNDNTYVGFYTGSTGGTEFKNTHSNTTASNVANELKNWYDGANWNAEKFAQYIDENAGFCNDRTKPESDTHGSSYTQEGAGSSKTVYGPGHRLMASGSTSYDSSGQEPTLKCGELESGKGVDPSAYERDLFTPQGASKGNKKLDVPVGLITADEVIFAGGFGGKSNQSYYLYNNQYFWTMSPWGMHTGGYASVFYVDNNGNLYSSIVDNTYGVRPVINLKADTPISFQNGGDRADKGTSANPYIVSTS